jgi:hypothetical protein
VGKSVAAHFKIRQSKSFCQRCGQYRYAYRRYTLGNIRTISGYFIISSDLHLANTNLNYICHTCSHDSSHLCYNPSINDDYMVPVHELWPFYVTLTLVAGTRIMCKILRFTMVVWPFVCQSLNKWWLNGSNTHFHLNFEPYGWRWPWPQTIGFCTRHPALQCWTFVLSYIEISLCM